jgi:hypothetical protein
MLVRPRLENLHELAADTQAAVLVFHNHANDPGRTVAPFLDIELIQGNRTNRVTQVIDRHPGDWNNIAAGLAQ